MKTVVFYESSDDVASKAPAHFAAHKEWYESFVAKGTLVLIGTFADPQADGAMSVFTNREDAEAFAAGDPFVTGGVVRRYTIKDWNEILG